MLQNLIDLWESTGVYKMLYDAGMFKDDFYKTLIMYAIVAVLMYLAIGKKYEPLLLLPIAFGMLLANLPGTGMFHKELFINTDPSFHMSIEKIISEGGLMDFLYLGVKLGIYPSLIFMAVGAMTDFTPLISNPKSLLLGAGAQFGIYVAFVGALCIGFTPAQAGAIGIIGGADGPTAILVTKTLAPELLGAIAVAAYSYMALIPIIQPPIMKLCTTKKERLIKMQTLRPVSQVEKIVFPIVVAGVVALILPDAAPLVGFLMLGNLLNVCGVTDRLSKTTQNGLCNVITIFLGVSVGITADAQSFLAWDTIKIIILGLTAFAFATFGGLMVGKVMCVLTRGKINPLIGSAGVSAVPMAARVSQTVGQKENPTNFLLMHAMGPNVAGVIGSAVAAGFFLTMIVEQIA